LKEYTEQGVSFTVSQIEVDNVEATAERRGEIIAALEKERAAKGRLFAALLVTDVTVLDSLLYVAGEKLFTGHIKFPAPAPAVYEMNGVVSRNKQLIPILSELVEEYLASS
jgi:manganese-dependent inorganic pyrophosphatase